MAFPFQIVGFDLDGTLLDTSGDLTAAVNVALAEAGRQPLTVEQVKPMIGGGAKHMLMQTLDATGGCNDDEAKRLYKLMLGYYETHLSVHTQPFPGMLEALDALEAHGCRVGVVTNKFESFAVQLLRDLNILDRFETVIGGDTLGRGNAKPSAAPIHELVSRLGGGSAAFVGDSIYDMQAARNAGVPSVAVSFGFLLHSLEEMRADAVIDGFDELVSALERLGG
ncbi:Phosphoglycolate phosphatase [Sphingomonas antarctica]|uniref:HAD-IA family hydrolase n=1 Tax=Sphingomonas antarctica TaxID=2040274 RepID=UPI0039E80655